MRMKAINLWVCQVMDNIISGRWTGNVQLLYVYHLRCGGSDVTVAHAQCAIGTKTCAKCAVLYQLFFSIQLKWQLEAIATGLALLVAVAIISVMTIIAQRLVVSTLPVEYILPLWL